MSLTKSTINHNMQASKALQNGQWEKVHNLILSVKIWSVMLEKKSVKEVLIK